MNCVASETELGPCEGYCGRSICAMRQNCVRPAFEPSPWRKLTRPFRVWAARLALAELEQHYRNLAQAGLWGPGELAKVRQRVEAARVNLAIAQR
jgi:hypothetical protein